MSNDLGKGIKIGGTSNHVNLKVIASDWARFEDMGWVKSGWLYHPDRNASLAMAFFKVHLLDAGSGYAQILGAANPPYGVWLMTPLGKRREEQFCWNDNPGVQVVAQWNFAWQ